MSSLDRRTLQSVPRSMVAAGRRVRAALRDPAEREPRHLRAGHRRLAALHPELQLVEGRLTVPHDTLMPAGAAAANFSLVQDALSAAGVQHSVLAPISPARHRVGVPAAQRANALAALRDCYADDAVYISPVGARPDELGTEVLAADAPYTPAVTRADTIRVTRNYVASAWPLRYGPTLGCDVSFYGVDGERALVPRPSDPPERVPEASLRATVAVVGDRTVRAAADLDVRVAGNVSFPVDVVYLWVDGSDPQWQRRKAAALQGVPAEELTPDGIDVSRFRDNDELRYSLRSLEMYAPWVRSVYLVTDDQRPAWLRDDHPQLTLVDHRDIFPDPTVLPNFNSQAISALVHHIDGLSEQYLLMNDDVFFGRAVQPEQFFHGNGLSQFFLSRHFLDHGLPEPGDAPQYTARRNSRQLIEELFGIVVKTTTKHTPIPMRRSVMAELEERFPDIFARTAASRFRDPSDYQIENVLHPWYAYCTGRAVPGSITYTYVPLAGETLTDQLDVLLRKRRADAFCINDQANAPASAAQIALVKEFLPRYFPVRSSFEKEPVAGGPAVLAEADGNRTRQRD